MICLYCKNPRKKVVAEGQRQPWMILRFGGPHIIGWCKDCKPAYARVGERIDIT
jgi:hypothetical protein